ncbi:MAG: hypothetical protein J6K61_05610 [Clostridia bacterium]|nr:hypothetical protein [Clostridia bacterium]
MKVCVIQPAYSFRFEDRETCFSGTLSHLEKCDESMDIIVLPEYSDTPTVVKDMDEFYVEYEAYNRIILEKARETAKRCNAIVFVNATYDDGGKLRNATHAINREGEVVGRYFKLHLAPSEFKPQEMGGHGMDTSYSDVFAPPYTVEIDGIRFAFMTCYDFYFYEGFAAVARQNVDVIIGCSHQRSDLHSYLETNAKFLCYQTNAYLLRSSVSLGAESKVGGCSLIATPWGEVIGNMKNDVGLLVRDIDLSQKYYKPAGFGGKPAAHYEYMEEGRRPANYRPGGSAIGMPDGILPYPRVCAHRGFSAAMPENSMPAFGAAVALGADEIEFDLWPTKDGEIVSCHDRELSRVSNGEGRVTDYTYQELLSLDFGANEKEQYRGLKIPSFEDILKKLVCHTVMNIHVKPLSYSEPYPEEHMKKICDLIRKYDCEKYVYFMLETDEQIKQFKEYAPHIPVCVGHLSDRPWEIVDRAIALGAEKVQLFKPYFNQEMIDKAHKYGIRCNVFFSDDEEETERLLKMGVDTVLTNEYLKISRVVKRS